MSEMISSAVEVPPAEGERSGFPVKESLKWFCLCFIWTIALAAAFVKGAPFSEMNPVVGFFATLVLTLGIWYAFEEKTSG